MKRVFLILITVTLMIALAGCSTPKGPWSFSLGSGYVTNAIPSSWGGYYYADAGYDWLVINIMVTNNLNTSQRLNPLIYSFDFETPDGLRYTNQLSLSSPVGGLQWSDVQPKQTISGEVYFELPESKSHGSGLVWFVDLFASGTPSNMQLIATY